MVVLLLALFLGTVITFQVTGTIDSMAEENVQLAVDLKCAADAMNLTSLLPIVIVVVVVMGIFAVVSMTQSFGAAYGE